MCDRIVEILCLRVLFPIFLRPASIIPKGKSLKKREVSNQLESIEEHSLSILLTLLKYAKRENKLRVTQKFIDNQFEKTDRLLELHFKYAEKLIRCDAAIKKQRTQLMLEDEPVDEDEMFMMRVTKGRLFVVQLIDQIIVIVSGIHDETVAERREQQLPLPRETIRDHVHSVVRMHASRSTVEHMDYMARVVDDVVRETRPASVQRTIAKHLARLKEL